ncbi:ANK2, partial [Symbiodinium pilosum]
MVHFAAMYGMKRVLAHVIDGLSDIEDESKITCPAEIIGIELPRYGERNQVIYDLRSLFTAADDRWTSLNLKQKLKQMKESFKGKTKEERELHEHIHYVAALDTEEASGGSKLGVQPLPPNFKKEHPMHLLAKTMSLRSPGQKAPDPQQFQEVVGILMAKVAESNSWMNLTKRDADGKSVLEYLVSSCDHAYACPVVETLAHMIPAVVLESNCFFAALDNPTGPARLFKALLRNATDRKILLKLLEQDQDRSGLNVVQICAKQGD